MARRSTTKSATPEATTVAEPIVDTATVEASIDTIEEVIEEVIEDVADEIVRKKVDEPLLDSDEIEVVSLIDNVQYKDSKTGNNYDWGKAGHVEFLTFDEIKNMWRSYKSYFKNLWLKPLDERVIKKLGITKTYQQFEFLTDCSNYVKKNTNSIINAIDAMPNGLKLSICNKIKSGVKDGEISDIYVIRTLERKLNLDLVNLL